MYFSFSLRVVLDAEALNMVESVGNYTRHRRAPLVVADNGRYVIRYVPAISGETLAHSYQRILADLAASAGLPVCDSCRRGEFLKHDIEEHFGNAEWEQKVLSLAKGASAEGGEQKKGKRSKEGGQNPLEKAHVIEKMIIENCVVEDVGGFLFTDAGVKRTSKVYFGYALPARDFYQASAIEPQFHVRHAPTMLLSQESEKQKEKSEGVSGQMIYYVETGSAVYAISGMLELSAIGATSFARVEGIGDGAEDRRKIALKALLYMLENQAYGAKRTRFLPAWTVASAVFALSRKYPFMVTTAHVADYITETAQRAAKHREMLSDEVNVWYYVKYEPDPRPQGAVRVETILDVYKHVAEIAKWKSL